MEEAVSKQAPVNLNVSDPSQEEEIALRPFPTRLLGYEPLTGER